jgi:hypothetical protein
MADHAARSVCCPNPPVLYEARYPLTLLNRTPVDLLTVDRGCRTRAPHGYEIYRWEDLLNHTDKANRPKVVVEIWASNAQTWERGPAGKVCRVRWQDRGYVSRFRRVDATQVGGAIQQVRFVAVRIQKDWASYWNWPEFEKDSGHVRSMSNLLTPPGLVSFRDYGTPGVAGTPSQGAYVPDARTEPMPNRAGRMLGSRPREEFGACRSGRRLGAWGCPKNGSGAMTRPSSILLLPRRRVCLSGNTCRRLSAMRSRTSQIRLLLLFGLVWLNLASTDQRLLPRCRRSRGFLLTWRQEDLGIPSVWSTFGWQRLVIRIPTL